MKKPTKLQVFYLTLIYFILFALVGAIFNVLTMAIAWAVSIFIIFAFLDATLFLFSNLSKLRVELTRRQEKLTSELIGNKEVV